MTTSNPAAKPVRMAVDIGGTFVDALSYDESTGTLQLHKAPTTPAAPARGVMDAVGGLTPRLDRVSVFAHGTTLGLNAILQRRGAPVGIITNKGFRDLFEIARAGIPAQHMYNFSYAPPPPLVPRRHRAGVPGRIDATGAVLEELDEDAVHAAGRVLVEEQGLSSLAVCFLHSYANPAHEQRAAEILRTAYPHVSVSVSSDITREYREYERTSTVTMDAYIKPVLSDYLTVLEAGLAGAGLDSPLHIMRSGGGAMTAGLARQAPLMTVLSGPAGGVIGASYLAQEMAWPRVLSFDVGGTSVDACVIEDGQPSEVYEAAIDGFPLLIPIYDIRTVGAGGGSIAWIDEGLLKVGPHSAGAVPGPVAYGAGGTEPTVTDAAFTLGYLDPGAFLDGEMTVSADAARKAVQSRIGEPLGIGAEPAAASIFRVLLARTVGALREITVERGLDPREFALLAFGGAGPMLGPMLAREMGIATTVIPQVPSAFSAFGMLMTDLQHEFSATVLRPLADQTLTELGPLIESFTQQGHAALLAQGVKDDDRSFTITLDIRYRGQEHALAIELPGRDPDTDPGPGAAAEVEQQFHARHRSRHGHAMPEPAEVLAVRVRATGQVPKPPLIRIDRAGGPPTPAGSRRAFDVATGQDSDFPVYPRPQLLAGHRLAGPAIVEEGTATTVLFADQHLAVDDFGQLLITSTPASEEDSA